MLDNKLKRDKNNIIFLSIHGAIIRKVCLKHSNLHDETPRMSNYSKKLYNIHIFVIVIIMKVVVGMQKMIVVSEFAGILSTKDIYFVIINDSYIIGATR